MITDKGPITCAGDTNDKVHMRQGDADGACGPYALMMGLITLGAIERNDITDMSAQHGNSRVGRFRNALLEHGALISGGTTTADLTGLANHFSGLEIQAEQTQGSKRALVERIQEDIECNAIPLISVSWSMFEGHWMIVVGHQGFEVDGVYQPTHLLCLDPASEPPMASLWNAVIEVANETDGAPRGGIFTCNH